MIMWRDFLRRNMKLCKFARLGENFQGGTLGTVEVTTRMLNSAAFLSRKFRIEELPSS